MSANLTASGGAQKSAINLLMRVVFVQTRVTVCVVAESFSDCICERR